MKEKHMRVYPQRGRVLRRARQVAVKMLLWAVCHVAKSNKEKRKKRGTNSMKNLWKKAQKMIACALALAFVFTMNAGVIARATSSSDDNGIFTVEGVRFSKGAIKADESLKLIIHKYSYDGETKEGTGLPVDMQKDFPTAKALPGVQFEYFKVADFVQSTDGSQVGLKYDLKNYNLKSLFSSFGSSVNDIATATELNNALLKAVAKDNLKNFEKAADSILQGGVVSAETDSTGTTTIDVPSQAQGLYLVVEYKAPATVQEKTIPFLVSLPMTNAAEVNSGLTAGGTVYPAGSLWQYDVHVYPKNIEVIPDIEKNIVREGTERDEKYESQNIGDTVTFRLKASIPADIATMSKFTVVDTMSKGLTYKRVKSIEVHDASDIEYKAMTPINTMEPDDSDYAGADKEYEGGKQLTWDFITSDMNYLKSFDSGKKELVIEYEAVLNENCVVGGMGNPNSVKLVYNHNAGIVPDKDKEEEHKIKSRVYTFGIDVTKIDGSGAENPTKMAGVKFRLYKDKAMTQEVKVVGEEGTTAGSYHPILDVTDATVGNDIITGDDEHARIYGLEPGTYYLKETATLPGFTLLKDPIEVKIKEVVTYGAVYDSEEVSYTKETGTFYKLIGGEYYPITIPENVSVYNFGTDAIYTKNEDGSYTQVSGLQYAYVEVDTEGGFTTNDGDVQLTVVNNTDFNLPQTGGIGTWMFTICGAVIVVAATGLILIRRKKSMLK